MLVSTNSQKLVLVDIECTSQHDSNRFFTALETVDTQF